MINILVIFEFETVNLSTVVIYYRIELSVKLQKHNFVFNKCLVSLVSLVSLVIIG